MKPRYRARLLAMTKAALVDLVIGMRKELSEERKVSRDWQKSCAQWKELAGANAFQFTATNRVLRPRVLRDEKHLVGSGKGGRESAKTRSGARSKRAAIIDAATKYRGAPASKAANIARKVGSTPRYVRMVLGEGEEKGK